MRRRLAGGLAALVAASALAGCFDPPAANCLFVCGAGQRCPADYACGDDNRCHRELAGGGLAACETPLPADAGPDAAP